MTNPPKENYEKTWIPCLIFNDVGQYGTPMRICYENFCLFLLREFLFISRSFFYHNLLATWSGVTHLSAHEGRRYGREEQRRDPIRVLIVDEGLCTLCRQQRVNLQCITITRGFPKLLPRHSFLFHLPAPPFCFVSLFTCNSHSLATRMDKCAPNTLICKQGLSICQTMMKSW